MCDKIKSMGLLAQITKGLLKHSEDETALQLGDRTKYIGMSDIGAGVECLRKAVGNKVGSKKHYDANDVTDWFSQKDFDKIQKELSRQLILQRGHWFERGVLDVLYCNTTNLFSQLEIEVEINNIPVKAHLDFVLVSGGDKPVVRILELKSCDKIPKHLYSSYEVQLYGQIGLLYNFWDDKVFNLKSDSGGVLFEKLTFPEIVQLAFGIELPEDVKAVDLEGWVLALSMKSAKAFGPYLNSEIMTDLCCDTAKKIWESAQRIKSGELTLNELQTCTGFNPLCDFCDFADDCPKFTKVKFNDEDCNATLKSLNELKEHKKNLCAEIEHIESQLKEFYSQCQVDGNWIDVGDYSFRSVESAGRKSFDKDALKSELMELIGDVEANNLFEKYTEMGSPSQRLYVKTNNN